MIKESTNMIWSEMHNIKYYSENTEDNKNKKSRKIASIILAAVQLMENYIKGIKSLSAFDASSIILSDANWIRNNRKSDFLDEQGNKVDVRIGTIYYLDFGNTFSDELAYFHHGLCVGKKEGKILIVPMTSGTKYFSTCYHPINNPTANKKYRQALFSEGFEKNCVLKLNDAKFISPGRIDKETVSINDDILKQIQEQLFSIEFPELFQKYYNQEKKLKKYEKQISEQKELISRLKQENNTLSMKLRKFENNIDTR
ncbi:MAG: hypothetical protein NC318_11645 [Blautia sp.]|nr:hypothetical protein [Blautia sp.]